MTEISAVGLNQYVDPRLAFLARAAARFELVKAGVMEIGEAFDGLIACLQCSCSVVAAAKMIDQWERDYPPARRLRNRRAAYGQCGA
jgi:hypothetical protein